MFSPEKYPYPCIMAALARYSQKIITSHEPGEEVLIAQRLHERTVSYRRGGRDMVVI